MAAVGTILFFLVRFGTFVASLYAFRHRKHTMSDDEILTARNITVLLKVVEKTLYPMTQAGDLLKVKGKRCDIDACIAAHVEHVGSRLKGGGGDK
jgi:hypothetical protein